MVVVQKTRLGFSRERAGQLFRLWGDVWPEAVEGPLEESLEHFFLDRSADERGQAGSERFHLIEGDAEILAVARSFVRYVKFDADDGQWPVLALAGVCSSPDKRGHGFGRLVVEDAFSRLGPKLPWCLFQTGVPEFYEKLGAVRVDNAFFNSDAEDTQANPWWDPHVMVLSAQEKWPEGRVDLCGPAY
ncbi:hypothetical protein [Pelagicoccus enzymogenes]|uniref:hypothetical protein n=1 Tax=Pelagicoccus enzymogenes TaxID=2773457 RepID=UPI0028121734|nr:hypothetical protein [Pelagicoccus enzymogenes]